MDDDANDWVHDDAWRSRHWNLSVPLSPSPRESEKGEDEPRNTSEPIKDPPDVERSLMLLCSAAGMAAALSAAPTASVGPDPGPCEKPNSFKSTPALHQPGEEALIQIISQGDEPSEKTPSALARSGFRADACFPPSL